MDPTSLTIGSLGLVESAQRLYNIIANNDDGSAAQYFRGLEIFSKIMAETALDMDRLLTRPRVSAVMAYEQCRALLTELEEIVNKTMRSNQTSEKNARLRKVFWELRDSKKVMLLMQSLKDAVLLFRQITTDSLTHQYLRDLHQQHTRGPQQVSREQKLDDANDGYFPKESPTRERSKQKARPPSLTPSETTVSDPAQKLTLFDATISWTVDMRIDPTSEQSNHLHPASECICGAQRRGVWFPVRGKYDSGSPVDLISMDVIERAHLQSRVYTSDPITVEVFGVSFTFAQRINLNWQLNNDEESYTQDFYVTANCQFDLIIGEPWLNEHGYQHIEQNESRKKSYYFGMLRLAKRTKDQKKRETEKAANKKAEAAARDEARITREDEAALDYGAGHHLLAPPISPISLTVNNNNSNNDSPATSSRPSLVALGNFRNSLQRLRRKSDSSMPSTIGTVETIDDSNAATPPLGQQQQPQGLGLIEDTRRVEEDSDEDLYAARGVGPSP